MFTELTDELLDLQATRKRAGRARAAMTIIICTSCSVGRKP